MKRRLRISIIVAALMAALCLVSGIALAEADVGVASPDAFYEEHKDSAPSYADSELFDVAFRVCDGGYEDEESMKPVRFQLALSNKGDETLEALSLTAHLNPTLQALLVNSTWYNEPIDLGTPDSETAPRGITHTWDALLDLRTAAMMDGVQAETFYDMVIELTWKGGSEILRIAPEDMDTLLEQEWIEPEDTPAVLMDAALAESITQAAEAFK